MLLTNAGIVLFHASLMLGVMSQGDFGGASYDKISTPSSTSLPGIYPNQEATPADASQPSTSYRPSGESLPGGSDWKSNVNKRDVRGTSSTELPSTTTERIPIGGGIFNRNRRESPTLKPVLPSSSSPSAQPPSTPSSGIGNRHRRDSFSVTFQPTSSSSSTEDPDRDSRLFLSFPTRDPSENSTMTTRRSLFNRNRRSTPKAPVDPVTLPTSTLGLPTTTTEKPLLDEDSSSSTTTRRSGIDRQRRNSHEFPPEEEQDHLAQGHVHGDVTASPLPSTSTLKNFHSRVQRSSEGGNDDQEDEQGSNKRPTSTELNKPGHPFHFGHSSDESTEISSSTSTTERQQFGGGRFRRSDDLGFPIHGQPKADGPSISSSTKELPSTTTQRPGGVHIFN